MAAISVLTPRMCSSPGPKTEYVVRAGPSSSCRAPGQSRCGLRIGRHRHSLWSRGGRGGSACWGTDISPKAVAVARGNAKRLGARVSFMNCGPGLRRRGPYRRCPGFQSALHSHLRGEGFFRARSATFEPRIALFAGPDGLDFYRRLIARGAPRAQARSCIVFELDTGRWTTCRPCSTSAGKTCS